MARKDAMSKPEISSASEKTHEMKAACRPPGVNGGGKGGKGSDGGDGDEGDSCGCGGGGVRGGRPVTSHSRSRKRSSDERWHLHPVVQKHLLSLLRCMSSIDVTPPLDE